jgi:NAD(P)H-hydrate epimerase
MNTLLTKKLIKAADTIAAKHLNIDSFELMQQAGAAIFSYLSNQSSLMVVTGAGNNAGDGFIIATLARKYGIKVQLWNLIAIDKLPPDAKQAAQNYLISGGEMTNNPTNNNNNSNNINYDYLVDAIFGTGLSRDVEGKFAQAIHWMNAQKTPILAVDIPSGLDADTGEIKACAIKAETTVSVISLKPGLVTNHGKDLCGQLFLENLGVNNKQLEALNAKITLLDKSVLKNHALVHHHNSHKGSFGQVVIAGGHDGMLGALILAGRSALQSGCGLVEVVSNNKQSVMISIHCPELITANAIEASRLLSGANVIAVGPGLGLNQQSKEVLNFCLEQNKPMVIDADALTLIAHQNTLCSSETVLTPHPKEAATLLNTDVATIQADRINAAINISQRYGACVILKGSGTVVANTNGEVFVCPYGYSGMATAGMGDVLTGIVASLMAQGLSAVDAANTAVVWHSVAAENCHKGNCLIASDVITQLSNEIQ